VLAPPADFVVLGALVEPREELPGSCGHESNLVVVTWGDDRTMTWVVAHTNPLAVVMLSDVRISVEVGRSIQEISSFGVKKIHHVAPTVFAGFAGSIALGFRLIDDLDVHLQGAYDPNVPTTTLATDWAGGVHARLAGFDHPSRSHRTSVIVAGMHLPPLDTGGPGTWGSGSVIDLPRGLDERAIVTPFGWSHRGVSIGSGSDVPEYQELLTELDWVELSNRDNSEVAMSALTQHVIERTPSPGVSRDLIAMIMTNGPNGIVGRGMPLGPMASNRTLIAEDEVQLSALWKQYQPLGQPQAAMATTARPTTWSSRTDATARPRATPQSQSTTESSVSSRALSVAGTPGAWAQSGHKMGGYRSSRQPTARDGPVEREGRPRTRNPR
jgi:hypothetical protein